jgi:hypothetical protein
VRAIAEPLPMYQSFVKSGYLAPGVVIGSCGTYADTSKLSTPVLKKLRASERIKIATFSSSAVGFLSKGAVYEMIYDDMVFEKTIITPANPTRIV